MVLTARGRVKICVYVRAREQIWPDKVVKMRRKAKRKLALNGEAEGVGVTGKFLCVEKKIVSDKFFCWPPGYITRSEECYGGGGLNETKKINRKNNKKIALTAVCCAGGLNCERRLERAWGRHAGGRVFLCLKSAGSLPHGR